MTTVQSAKTMIINQPQWWAGLDLHKNYVYLTVIDKHGTIYHQDRYDNKDNNKLIKKLTSFPGQVNAVVESTYGWYWLVDKLESAGLPVVLAHPQKVKAIAGSSKTDAKDSFILANLLRMNHLPTSYMPEPNERQSRELLRFRFSLVEQLSTVKRRLRDILAKQNLNCPYRDITSLKAQAWFKEAKIVYPYQAEVQILFDQAKQLKAHIKSIDQIIDNHVKANPSAQLLMTIPGVGRILGLTIAVEIGNIDRFPRVSSLAAYVGIVPRVYASGGKTYLGSINRHGNKYLRWALAEASLYLIKHDTVYKSFYDRLIKRGKPKPKARVAVMHKLTRAIYTMLKKNIPFIHHQMLNGR